MTGILCDRDIARLCRGETPMISPFVDHQVRWDSVRNRPVISYGLSSAGYDIRLQPVFDIFSLDLALEHGITEIDPLNFDRRCLRRIENDSVLLPSGSYLLGTTVEFFRMPRDVKGRCDGKSTQARAGIQINVTPAEPGWEGELTIEIGNGLPIPVRIHAFMGIAQLEFSRLANPPDVSYADRGGKYQGQRGITTARL